MTAPQWRHVITVLPEWFLHLPVRSGINGRSHPLQVALFISGGILTVYLIPTFLARPMYLLESARSPSLAILKASMNRVSIRSLAASLTRGLCFPLPRLSIRPPSRWIYLNHPYSPEVILRALPAPPSPPPRSLMGVPVHRSMDGPMGLWWVMLSPSHCWPPSSYPPQMCAGQG